MSTESSDGKSTGLPSVEIIAQNTAASASGEEKNTRPCPPKTYLGDFQCRTFAFVGGDKPHFIFSTTSGYARLFVTDTHIALLIEDSSKHIGEIVRKASR